MTSRRSRAVEAARDNSCNASTSAEPSHIPREASPPACRRHSILKGICVSGAVSLLLVAGLVVVLEWRLRRREAHIVQNTRGKNGEIVSAALASLHTYEHGKGARLQPDVDVIIRNHQLSRRDIRVQTNSLGFRDHEIPAKKAPNEFRVLVLGDSITCGDYLEADEVWVERAAFHLSKAFPSRLIEMINAGVGDIGIREEIDILREKGLQTHPDVVLLAFYVNDSRPPFGFPAELGGRGWLRRHSLLAETLYKQFKLRQWIREQGKDRFGWFTRVDDFDWANDPAAFRELAHRARFDWGAGWEQEAWPDVDAQLDALAALARAHGFRVAVVAFPVSFQVEAKFLEDEPQRKVRDKAQALGFAFHDLLPGLRLHASERLFFDHCHPVAAANDMIGKDVADFLARTFLNPPPVP